MSAADIVYKELVSEVLQTGEVHENRTGVNTRRIWGHMAKFDLNSGFPLLTQKKIAVKAAFVEMLGFVRGETDVTWYQQRGCKIWDADHARWHGKDLTRDKARLTDAAWTAANLAEAAKLAESVEFREQNPNSLGEIYGFPFRSVGGYSRLVKTPMLGHIDHAAYPLPALPSVAPDGAVRLSDSGGFNTARTGDSDEQGRPLVRVTFCASGYSYVVRKDQADRLAVRDPYAVSVSGVGSPGEPDVDDEMLRATWRHMLDRCYVQTCKEYSYYGAVGVTVCDRWKRYDLFAKDVRDLPGWINRKTRPTEFELDKDVYSSDCYSPRSCVWVPSEQNKKYRHRGVVGISPDGQVHLHASLRGLCEDHGLCESSAWKVMAGERKHHRGWTFKLLSEYDPNGRYAMRYDLPTDQFREIIEALKAGSNSRRLIMTAWVPNRFHLMSLPPCHVQYHFSKRGEFVDVSMIQRSADVALGLPFNWATTALLTHLVGNATNLKPGRMVWFGDDVHIYEPHVAGFDIQFAQKAYVAPQLEITAPGKMPWEIEYSDIDLINYQHSETVKFELFVG